MTHAEGKKARLVALVDAMPPGAPVYVVAAFGNSYAADGALLAHVAAQRIPASRPAAVMINAGVPPPAYQGLFHTVQMTRTLGDD